MLEKTFQKGDIWLANLNYYKTDNQSSRQEGIRPVLVTSNFFANKYSPVIDVTPITSNLNKNNIPVHVFIPKECGLLNDSLALVEQDQPVDKSCLFKFIGRCSEETMKQIDRAIMLQKQITAMPVDINKINQYVKAIEETTYYSVITGVENDFILNTLYSSLVEYCEVMRVDLKSLLKTKNIKLSESIINQTQKYAFA
jgi:mRNA interferase MazF